jgi:nitrogen fixation/metabolism regulation signal transduction histidine kinase
MASNKLAPARFALAIGLRATLVGLLFFVVFWLVFETRLYACAAIAIGFAGLMVFDIARLVARVDAQLGLALRGLAIGHSDEVSRSLIGFHQIGVTLGDVREKLVTEREASSRSTDHLQALLDTVSAALLIIDERGAVRPANRAARRIVGAGGGRLDAPSGFSGLGPATAKALNDLPYGGRKVLRLADGQAMLALGVRFDAPERGALRLISLQPFAGELDVVEMKAWQDLARVLAHEIMNSLTPIASLAESLTRLVPSADTPLTREVRGEIVDAVDVIARRSAGLLGFVDRYRTVADLPTPRVETVDLADVIGHVESLMATRAKACGVELSGRVRPDALTVTADSALLEQAIINLVLNAIEAVEGATDAWVSVQCERVENVVTITVIDNGAGISPDNLDRLFVPFFSTKAGGAGIGLNLVRQIALAHNGRVDVTARSGGGSVFTLTLPVD